MVRNIIGILGTLVLLACDSTGARPLAIEARDSAGVEVVTVTELPSLTDTTVAWPLTLVRSIPGGGGPASDDPVVIYDPMTAASFSGDTLVIHDKGPERVLVVDERDSVVARFARPGRGPGEVYGDGVTLLRGADGRLILVERWGNMRITQFTLSGEVITDRQLPRISSAPWGPGRSGSEIVVPIWTPNSTTPAPFVDSLARLDIDAGTIVPFAALPPRYVPGPEGVPLFFPINLWTSFATGDVVVGKTDSGSFQVMDEHGTVIRVLHLPITPKPVTQAMAAQFVDENAGFLAATRFGEGPDRFYSHHRIAGRLHTIDDSTFAIGHAYWVLPDGDELSDRHVTVWRVLHVRGTPLGIVHFPPRFRPFEYQNGLVTGVTTDSLGVPTVEVYALHRPRDRPR